MPAFALNLSPAPDHRHIPTAIAGSKTASIPLANLLSSIMGQVYTSCLAVCAESEAGGMPELRPSRAERTPLFEAVGAALKREIASGRFTETDVLPGERELSEMLDVSRTTLRRAIAGLVDEGVLAHRHGAGTFVRRNPPHVEQPLSRLTSFTEDMRLRGLTASSRVIERGSFLPTPEEAMMLGIASSGVGRYVPCSITREDAVRPRSRMSSVKLVRRDSGCSTCGGLDRKSVV